MEEVRDSYPEVNLVPLENKSAEIAERIMAEDDIVSLQKEIQEFNINQSKKNVMRVMKYDYLLDKVSDQMIERVEKRPGEFSHSDLISYMQAIHGAMDRANKAINLVEETPAIALQQNNQVNINIGNDLDSESKGRVIAAIQSILSRGNKVQDTIQTTAEDVSVKEDPITDIKPLSEESDDAPKEIKKKRGRPKKSEVKNND